MKFTIHTDQATVSLSYKDEVEGSYMVYDVMDRLGLAGAQYVKWSPPAYSYDDLKMIDVTPKDDEEVLEWPDDSAEEPVVILPIGTRVVIVNDALWNNEGELGVIEGYYGNPALGRGGYDVRMNPDAYVVEYPENDFLMPYGIDEVEEYVTEFKIGDIVTVAREIDDASPALDMTGIIVAGPHLADDPNCDWYGAERWLVDFDGYPNLEQLLGGTGWYVTREALDLVYRA